MNRRDVLASSNFGKRIAEDESEMLVEYFVETEQWRRVFAGEVDVVYGPKGSGKSALYSLLRAKRDELKANGIIPAAGENVRGTPVFEGLVVDPPASEDQFRSLWKFYFLSLVGTAFRILKIDNGPAQQVLDKLQDAGLISSEWSLRRMLKAALDYVRRIESVGGEVRVDPATLHHSVGGKITLREPSDEQLKLGYVSADTLLELADKALAEVSKRFWITLDRLDVAFSDSPDLEGNALRALFRVYRDISGLSNISLKIFLRDDIWNRITKAGFREASHITDSILITWDSRSLLNLVVRRLLHNPAIVQFYGIEKSKILSSSEEQEQFFYRVFPTQVDAGAKKPNTLDWMLTRTADGSGKPAPREIIHLLSSARDQQLRAYEMGASDPPPGEALFDRAALKAAMPEVSKIRFEQTLLAEHSAFKHRIQQLEGEKTQQTIRSLAKVWGVNTSKALADAEVLVEIGFFEKRGPKEEPIFWVPFLYRDALHLVQGPAE